MSSAIGFIGEGSLATFTCEVHGYTSVTNPTISWSVNGEEALTDSSKYGISETTGFNQLISFNNSTKPSVISNLEIRELSCGDQANYTCMTGSETVTTALFVSVETAPSITLSTTTSSVVSKGN